MAGGNMGDLSFTLTVKSDLERKMKSYSDAIKQAKKEVDNLQNTLASAKTAKDNSAVTSLNQQLKEAKANVRDMESNWKRADTRMQQVLDKAHDIDNVLKSMSASSSKAKFFNAADAENAVNRISSAIRSLLELAKGGANAPLFTGEGFRAGIGDVKRGIADVKSGFKDITTDAKAAEKSVNDFGKAENKAAEYYRTRKQRVDDAISSLSKKQAEFARLQEVSSADDVRMLKAASEQAEILKQRLLAAKTEYEQMQRFKSMGVPGAALSSTFLGRYTGMSELFGANFSKFAGQGFRDLLGSNFSKQDNLSYNDFTAKAKEIVDLAKQHNSEIEKRLKLEEREAELLAKQNAERKVSVKNTQMDTAPIEKQIEQYEKAIAAYKQMQSIREQMNAAVDMGGLKGGAFLGSEYAGLEQKLQAFKEAFTTFGNGFSFDKIQSELQTLYALLGQFNAANTNAKPLISETHDEFTLEKQRLAQQERHQLRQQEIEDAFRAQDAYRKNAEANAQTERRVHEELIRLQNERRQNQLDNLAKIEAKERELAELYGKLRSSRDNGLKNGADVSQIEKDLQAVRELYSEMQRLRRDVPTDKGWNPIGFSASETANMQRHMQGVATEVQRIRNEAQGATNAARDLASAFDRVHNSASKSSQVLSDIKSLFLQGGIVFAAQQFANSIIKTGGDIVQQHIALRSILGDVQKADTLFAQTQQLALQSPFTFQQLNRDVKQLAAFGVDTDRLYDTTKRLADVASGLGVSFERLGLAYGQVKARSWLDGKELRQFAYAGLPMLQKIADLYNDEGKNGRRDYTTSDVRNMITKREVSFEDVDAVFKRLTDEGGQFYNMQFVLSDTLLGKWNKLQDAWTIMLGKFADGSNILGSAFIGVIDTVTTLIQKLDQLSPLVMSFGALFALRKGASVLSSRFGAGTIIADMQKAQTLALTNFQIRQMTQVAEGKITMEQARQNIATEKNLLASKEAANMKYMQLAAEGKLSAFQLGRLAANQKIDVSLVHQLVTTGQISRYQALLILQAERYAGTMKGAWAQMQLGATSLWGSIKGFFTWGNALMVGIIAAMSVVLSHEQKLSEFSSKAEGVTNKYTNKAAELNDTLTKVNGKISTESIQAMEGALSKAGQLTDEVKNQVAEADTLNEKYEILKNKMQETLNMASQLRNKGVISRALSTSGGDVQAPQVGAKWYQKAIAGVSNFMISVGRVFGAGSDYISDNLAKVSEYSNYISNMTVALSGNFNEIDKALKKTTDAAHDSVFYEQVKDLPFEKKIRQILESNYADEFLDNLDEIDHGAYKTADKLHDYIVDVDDIIQEIVQKNIPYAVNSLKNDMGLLHTDTKNWSQQQVNTFVWMFNQIMTAAGEMSDYVRSKVWQSFLASSGLMNQLNPDKKRVHTYTDPKTHKPWLTLYVGKEGDDKKGHYIIVGFKGNQPVKQYNSAADAPKLSPRTRKLEPDSGSKNKNGKQKSNNADAERHRIENEQRKADNDDEKSLRARLNLIKEAYDTYQKYYKLLHNESEAAKIVSEQYKDKGLSNDDVAKITSREGYLSLVDDYLTRARNIQYRRPSEMKDKKDEDIAAGVQEKNAQNYDKLQNDMQEVSSEMSHTLDNMSRMWENYNTIYKATGNAELAAQVSGISGDMNASDRNVYANKDYATGFVQNYSEYLKNYIDSLLWSSSATSQTAIDYDSLIGKSDKDIENFAGKLFADKDPKMINGMADALKKLRDLMSDSEFKAGIQVYSDLMNQIVTESAVVARNTQAYNDTIHKLDDLLNGKHITQEQYNQAKGVADAANEHQDLIASDKYKQFMGQVTSMTENAAKWMRDRIINDLDQQFTAGNITIDKYIEGLKQVNEQMQMFQNQHGNGYAFFTGGLSGLANNIDKKNEDQFYNQIALDKLNGGGKFWANGKLTEAGSAAMGKMGSAATTIAIVDAIVNGINKNVQSYKKLEETWTDAFGDGLKNSKFSNFMGGFTEASQGAADAWNSLKSGDIVGTLEGGIRSFNGWFSWGNAAANKRWQKQAEYLKGFQSTLNEINSTLKNKVSSNYGSMSASYAKEVKSNLNSEAEQVRKTYYDWSQAHTLHKNHRNRMYTNLDSDAINQYLQSIGYTGDKVHADTIQNLDGTWLEKIRDRFAGDWSRIPEDAREYLNRLIAIEGETGELKDTTDKLKEALTDLNVDNLQSEYEELLNNLDSDNEDFADNLENHLRKAILNTMIANLYKKQIEDLVNFTNEQATNSSYVSRSGQVKQHSEGEDPTDVMSEYTSAEYEAIKQKEDGLAEQLRNSRDYLKDLYGWSDSNSSSMSSSIKGMPEQTGDLVAAYLNAIRADVSVIRQLSTVYLPKIDITTEAQLQQLNMIAANTLRNADAAERIEVAVTDLRDNFNRAQNQAKPLYVKTV